MAKGQRASILAHGNRNLWGRSDFLPGGFWNKSARNKRDHRRTTRRLAKLKMRNIK